MNVKSKINCFNMVLSNKSLESLKSLEHANSYGVVASEP